MNLGFSSSRTWSISAVICWNDAPYALDRTRRTMFAPKCAGSTDRRTTSLRRRLSLFRATAVLPSRGTISPTRIEGLSDSTEDKRGEAEIRTSICGVRMRFPSRAMRCNSAPRVIRAARGYASDDLDVLRSSVLVWNANGQLRTSLLAATRQCCASPFGFHASTESVRLEPARVARAVSGLPHDYSRCGLCKSRYRLVKLTRTDT